MIEPQADVEGGNGAELPEIPPDMAGPKRVEDALRAVAKSWLSKLQQAEKHKRPFSEDAKEAMNFFDGSNNWFWKDATKGESGYSRLSPPAFRITINRVFEAVKLFGAVIYHRNPVRTVTPKTFPVVPPVAVGIDMDQPPPMDPATGQPMPNPMIEQFIQVSRQVGFIEQIRRTVSNLLETYLNYTPNELNLKENSRKVVDEAIIKGLGVWWTELITIPETDASMVGSFMDSCDNILWDPDADEQEDILWAARRCIHPVDVVAKKYGLQREDLKGHLESYVARSKEEERDYRTKKRNGKTNDLCVYWKIYSKTGFGHTLKDAPKDNADLFQDLGDNCYIVVCEGVDFPLNVPKQVAMEEQPQDGSPGQIFMRTRWPIPFYADHNGWPFTPLQFHRKPGYSWPISHLKPGVAELKFLNWAMSFLATRIATSCNTLIGVSKAADQDIKDQINAQSENGFNLVELSETLGRSVNDVISVFQLPQVTPDIWNIISAVAEMFDRRVGLTELVYGMTRSQFRSAAEAQVKSEQISVRPDDMANVLEDAMSELARKEALAARWLLRPEDVAPVLGPLGAQAWEMHVQSLDIHQVAREYEYRVEAGSARKPNKASRVEQMQMALQTLGPVLQGLIPQGIVDPFNALITDWAKSLDIDPAKYLLPPPPPPPAPQPPGAPASPPGSEPLPPGEGGGGAPPPEEPPPQVPQELQP
jgi:hypothetical protein